MLCEVRLCHGFATRGVEPLHRFLQPQLGRVQVRARLRQVRVAEYLLHMMDRPALLKPAAAGFVSKVVEVEITLLEDPLATTATTRL